MALELAQAQTVESREVISPEAGFRSKVSPALKSRDFGARALSVQPLAALPCPATEADTEDRWRMSWLADPVFRARLPHPRRSLIRGALPLT